MVMMCTFAPNNSAMKILTQLKTYKTGTQVRLDCAAGGVGRWVLEIGRVIGNISSAAASN